jgi:hypothetical protein
MDVRPNARSALASERRTDMAKKTASPQVSAEPQEGPALRRCIGSARFGFEAHDAPVEDFPRQPSQKDGLGRMCKTHWRQCTAGLERDAKARKAAGAEAPASVEADVPAKPRSRKRDVALVPVAGAQGDAG